LYRSDLVLKLTTNFNKDIEKKSSVKKITNHKYFCSLLVGKNKKFYMKNMLVIFQNHNHKQ